MPSLKSASQRFNQLLYKEGATPFAGTISVPKESVSSGAVLASERLMLRVSQPGVVFPREVINDGAGRRFLVANHGLSVRSERILYATYRLIEINADLEWSRQTTTKDALTGLKRSETVEQLGTIPVLIEFDSEQRDGTIKVAEDVRRIVTGAAIKLGDRIDGSVVKRTSEVLGVIYGEIA